MDKRLYPFKKGFSADRSSPGSNYQRSFGLEFSTNGSIYLRENEYGGSTMCPTEADLRWLRDVLNKIEFCDHELEQGECWNSTIRPHRICTKCGTWIYDGRVDERIQDSATPKVEP